MSRGQRTRFRSTGSPTTAVAVGLWLFLAPRAATATDIGDFEVAAKIGGGSPGPWSQENPLAVGIGARAGASWRGKIYAGLTFVDYLGETDPVATGSCVSLANPCKYVGVAWHSVLVGVEGGYGFKLRDVVIVRPQLGAGDMILMATGNATYKTPSMLVVIAPATTDHPYLEPGLTVLVPIHPFFVGADVNALWLVRDTTSSVVFTGHAQLGITF